MSEAGGAENRQEARRSGSSFPWFVLGLMSSVTFVGILSELSPSGVLPEMSDSFGITEAQAGLLVGTYALASAIFAIPLVSATLPINRKKLLLALLAGFAVSNLVVAVSGTFWLAIVFRVVGGICAGVMWPMIAAYGSRLVSDRMQGRAVTVVMAGNTLGIAVGMPIMTTVGTAFGWRIEFGVLAALIALIGVLSVFVLPSVEGERRTESNSLLTVLKNRALLVILVLTLFTVIGHYGTYTYITLLVDQIDLAGGVGLAMVIFGVGAVISVVVSAKYIDRYLRGMVISLVALGAVSMAIFVTMGHVPVVSHLAFFLWGLSFGPLVTMYQTAVIKRMGEARDVGTSVQSSVFNFSIMIATWVGGRLLEIFVNVEVMAIVVLSLGCFAVATIVGVLARKTLRS